MKKIVYYVLVAWVGWFGITAMAQLPVEPLDESSGTTQWMYPKETIRLSKPVVLKSIENDANYFILEAKIDQKKSFYFLLDTGSGISILSLSLVKELNLPVTTKRTLRINGVQTKVTFHRVKSIQMDEAQFLNYDFAVLENSEILDYFSQKENIKLDGILGFGLFKEYLLTLDPQNHSVILEQNQLNLKDPDTSVYLSEKRVPMIPVLFEKDLHKINILSIVDTGFSGFFALPSHMQTFPFSVIAEEQSRITTGLGQFQATSSKIDANVFWGNQKIEDPHIIHSKQNGGHFKLPYGLIGIKMLAPYQVTFDQKNSLIKIKKIKINENSDLESSSRKVERRSECDWVRLDCLDNQFETIRDQFWEPS